MINKKIISAFILLFSWSFILAQSQRFEFEFENKSFIQIFTELQNEKGILFSYKVGDIPKEQQNFSIKTNDLETLLQTLFKETDLETEIVEDKYVILKLKSDPYESRNELKYFYGQVIDEETQEPLPYANIYFNQTSKGTSSDEQGNFKLGQSEKDGSILTVSYVGFSEKIISLDSLGKEKITISLKYDIDEDAFLVIKDYINDGISLKGNGSITTIDPTRSGVLPGLAQEDVLHSIKLLPGVKGSSSKASDLSIRGCTSDQNLIHWEQIPIYHSAHYFGMISSINPHIVDKINVMRSGFDAQYGGRIAGIIELESNPITPDKSKSGIGFNTNHGFVYTKQRFKNGNKLILSARRSFSEWIRSPSYNSITRFNQQGFLLGSDELNTLPDNIKVDDTFNFFDAHFKTELNLNEKTKFSLSGLYALNDFNDRITDRLNNKSQTDKLDLSNYGFNVGLNRAWNENFSSDIRVGFTDYSFDYDYKLFDDESQVEELRGIKSNGIKDLQLQWNNNTKINKYQSLELGYHLIKYNVESDIKEKTFTNSDISEKNNSSESVQCIYAVLRNPIENKIGFNLGGRINQFRNKFYIEPRLRLDYKLTDIWTCHASFGIYHQFISQLTEFKGNKFGIQTPIWVLAGKNTAPLQKSNLLQIGTLLDLSSWLFDLQIYNRQIEGINTRAFDFETIPDDQALVGNASVQGIDILIKKRFPHFRIWLSYSLSQNLFNIPRDGLGEFYFDNDQTHSVNFTNQYVSKNFEFSLGINFSSGLPYSRMIDFQINNGQMNEGLNYTAIYDGINKHRLQHMLEFNISAQYKLDSPKHYNSYIAVSITNFFDNKNLSKRNFTVDTEKGQMPSIDVIDYSNLRFTPELSIRFEF